MRALAANDVLTAWERGHCRHPLDRALLLYAMASPEMDPDTLADQPLGRRNVALLKLRQLTFGSRLGAYLDCPQCGERLEFEQDTTALLSAHRSPDEQVDVAGWRFRLPTTRDLAHVSDAANTDAAAFRLLCRCLVLDDGEPPSDEALVSLAGRVEEAMEQADPLAEVSFDFVCEICGHVWVDSLDVADYLWEEIEAKSARIFDEVHRLAQAYGWRESDILELTDARRAAYLQRAAA